MLDGEGPLKAEPFYYQLDHLGTPQELTSYGGEILWSARYRAYGNVARLEVAEIDNPLRFQGQYYDAETGLHYNRHRYYNPNTGRFLTPDPIKLTGGLNHYQYVPNPTGWVDPLGLASGLTKCPRAEKENKPFAENVEFETFEQARNSALDWLGERGFKAEKPTIGKFGENAGKPIGMQTSDGKVGYRIEYDERNGAHINVWSGKEKGPHYIFNATPQLVLKLTKALSR
ncbi:RHS repeat-associated protein [Pseudomonas citronellolis]|nr:RHS repeat-associated core domain-containing protein [Pseudomonas citronellolis]MCP1642212.1 RHS repeat-associated protein [Pseudomonas citronellolis]MCP1668876.1 RHS repeat-associated protein [Pseudomonas citronellolis]MCP1697916.1 RHS repeat-associated protein [Pseudomonas citronellolis]MCP1704839.1 RHS repeat-associated protein [Pseudomonas citronellolis]MCP1799265.1 RHS repeat-associated protein [Pseudomonas citronellolis]